LARAEGVPLIAPDDALRFDLAVDGADEVDPQRRLIKGAGGALLREKMIAAAADRFIVIVDAAKVVDTLGAFKLPIEVAPFAVGLTQARLRGTLDDLGYAHATLRLRTDANGTPIITDGGNPILDCECAVISDAEALACALDSIPGVFEHGLFLGMTHQVLVGDASGVVRSF
jgi:ribose 5-phosphate isomerase A